jgi:hypothetical protein
VTEARTLDFIVMGVARSGTTGLVRGINQDPECYCSHEYFQEHHKLDYSTVNIPGAFFDAAYAPRNERTRRNVATALRAKLDAGTVARYGDKQPRYFLVMESINRQLPGLRSVIIHRSPAAVADSWDRRALNDKDRWPRGRTGYIGLAEWIIAFLRLAETRIEHRIVDFSALFQDDLAVFTGVMAYLRGSPPSAETVERFAATEFRGGTAPRPRSASRPRKAWVPRHDTFARSIGAADMDAVLRARALCTVGDIRPLLAAFVDAAIDPVFAYLTDALAASDSPEEKSFALAWAGTIAATYDDPRSPGFARIWPKLVALASSLVSQAGEEDRRRARQFAQILHRRLGDAAPMKQLRPLLRPAA